LFDVNEGFNSIANEGAKEIANALSKCTALTTLKLGALFFLLIANNQVGSKGFGYFIKALGQNRSLTYLDVGTFLYTTHRI